MYAWIWRHLPFNLPGKIISSVGLVLAITALLWYVVFPRAEPLLPFDDVQVTEEDGSPAPAGAGATPAVDPTADPTADEHAVPYPTHTNNPAPNTSPSR